MASSTTLTPSEQDLVDALRVISKQDRVTPRPAFSSSLRDRLMAEANEIELAQAEAFQAALEGLPADPALVPLASFAAALASSSANSPAGSFRFGLRNQLADQNVTDLRSARATRSFLSKRLSRKLVLAASISMMMVSSTATVFAAAANDTPADALFGVKRFGERVQTMFVSGPEEGVKLLSFAGNRVNESEVMVDRDIREPRPYEIAFDLFQTDLISATELILKGHELGDPAAAEGVPELARFLTLNLDRVTMLSSRVPTEARSAATEALSLIEKAVARTEGAVAGCIICSPATTVPENSGVVEPCISNCTPGSTTPGTSIIPKPADQGPITKPNPRDETITPEEPPTAPLPTPIPRPNRLPDLPGGLDRKLEGPANDIAETLGRLL